MRFSIGSFLSGVAIGVTIIFAAAKFYPDPRSEELARLQGRFDVIQSVCPLMVDKVGLKPAAPATPAPTK